MTTPHNLQPSAQRVLSSEGALTLEAVALGWRPAPPNPQAEDAATVASLRVNAERVLLALAPNLRDRLGVDRDRLIATALGAIADRLEWAPQGTDLELREDLEAVVEALGVRTDGVAVGSSMSTPTDPAPAVYRPGPEGPPTIHCAPYCGPVPTASPADGVAAPDLRALIAVAANESMPDGLLRVAYAASIKVVCRACQVAAVPDPERPTRCPTCNRTRNT